MLRCLPRRPAYRQFWGPLERFSCPHSVGPDGEVARRPPPPMPTMRISAVAAIIGAALEWDQAQGGARVQDEPPLARPEAEARGTAARNEPEASPVRAPAAPALVAGPAVAQHLPAPPCDEGNSRRPEAKASPGPSARKSAPPRPPTLCATPKGKAAPAHAAGTRGSKGAAPDTAGDQPGQEDSASEYYSSYSESQSSEPPAQEEEKAPGPAGPKASREAGPPEPPGAGAPRSPPMRQRSPRRPGKEGESRGGGQTPRGRGQGSGRNRIVQVLYDGPPAHQPDLAAGDRGSGLRRCRSPSVHHGDRRWVSMPREESTWSRGQGSSCSRQAQRRRQDSRSPDRRRSCSGRSRSRRGGYRSRGHPDHHQSRPRQEGKGSQEGWWWPRGGDPQEARRQGQMRVQNQGAPQGYNPHRRGRVDPPDDRWRQPHRDQGRGRGPSPERQQGRGKGKKGKGAKGKHRRDDQRDQPRAEPRSQDNARRRERAAQRHSAAADALRARAPGEGDEDRPQETGDQPSDPAPPAEPRPSTGWFE